MRNANEKCPCWQECDICDECGCYECECECCDCGDAGCDICHKKISAKLKDGFTLGEYAGANTHDTYAVIANNSWGKPSKVITSGNNYDALYDEFADFGDDGEVKGCTTARGVRPSIEILEFSEILEA